MYKMLVVDDEYLVRLGIKETIEWNKYDIEIIAEADNGKKGVELAEELKPDLIISDVKMPLMDGLELVKAIKKMNLDCSIIILSGYNEFDYAKGTLENGATSYLLKPIDNDELIEKVLQALEELKENRKTAHLMSNLEEEIPSVKRNIVLELINGKYLDIDKIKEKINLYQIPIYMEGYVLYGQIDHPENSLDQRSIDYLYQLVIKKLNDHHIEFYGILFEYEFMMILKANRSAQELEKYSNEVINQYEKKNLEVVTLSISRRYNDLNKIQDVYEEAKLFAKNKLFPMLSLVTTPMISTKKYSPLVIEAMNYIGQNYNQNLTVKMVADELYVSESHLMHIFKNDLNKTFNECLTDYRMLAAKKMLLSGNYKVYEIAELVGYNDSKYFSQIFKKRIGLSPSEYIEQQLT